MFYCEEHLGCSGQNIEIYSEDQNLVYEKCNDCGLIWRSKQSENFNKNYEQDYFESKNYDKNREHKVKKSGWLIDLARLKNSKLQSLLEVGCSIGYTLEAAQKRNIAHLGIDISKYAVEYCTKRGFNASNQSLDELNDAGEKYDVVYMQHVLEHFENPFEVLQKCNSLLNSNGLLLILVPNSKYSRAAKGRGKHRFYSLNGVGAEHFVYFNYNTLGKVLESQNFTVVQQNYPVFTGRYFSAEFFLNRLFRRLTGLFNADQELLVIARKND